jgi:hypothetical protein
MQRSRNFSTSVGIRSPNVIFFATNKLSWSSCREALKRLYGLAVLEGHSDIVLDLSLLDHIYPNGIVPIVAQVDALRNRGKRFQVVPPTDREFTAYCERMGWLHYLDPERFSQGHDVVASTALHRFSSDEELNSLINRVVEISLQQLVFAEGVPTAFEWTINEIAGNVLVHAQAPGFLQVITYRENRRLVFTVCDSGIGIPATIRETFEDVHGDVAAIELAIRAGVTSKPDFGQGNGLAGSLGIAKESGGLLSITSGRAWLRLLDGNLEARRNFPPYNGTCVDMQLPVDKPINLPNVLWGHEPIPHTELKFEDDKGDLTFKLREYAASFGNRITGEKIRNLVSNLLIQHSGHRVKIQFDGIAVIASSFADELFGKLALTLGVVDFGRLIAFENINALCKSLMDTAIQQRLAQGLGNTLMKDSQQKR